MPPNFVLINWDDCGQDQFGSYYAQPVFPIAGSTERIDAWAETGIKFHRHSSGGTLCSPGRANWMTGLLGNRNGIGFVTQGDSLSTSFVMLPQLLQDAGYRTTAVGKWHLGQNPSITGHPLACGFQRFEGVFRNVEGADTYTNYPNWYDSTSLTPNTPAVAPGYLTEYTATKAIAQLAGAEPFFLYISFNAPHSPFHTPPVGYGITTGATPKSRYRAMKTATDIETDRILQSVDLNDTIVIFTTDNGTDTAAIDLFSHAKGTVYLGGIRTPMFWFGAGIEPGESHSLICSTDLPATILELAGLPAEETMVDSISYAHLISDPSLSGRRGFTYSETFAPNGLPLNPTSWHLRSAEDYRYHLIHGTDTTPENADTLEMFDLQEDPFEFSPLDLNNLTREEQESYFNLSLVIESLGYGSSGLDDTNLIADVDAGSELVAGRAAAGIFDEESS